MLVVGSEAQLSGDVTRLGRIGAKGPALVERDLGYAPGRLAEGYWVAVLKEPLRPNHVRFGGLTLRSGGRDGLPVADPVRDAQRKAVHDGMIEDYGALEVRKMLEKLAGDARNLAGDDRIIKFLPVTRHVGANPAAEYPPGEGSPQYTLLEKHRFFVAIEIGSDLVARTAAGWSVSVADTVNYDDRARLRRYLAAC